MTVCAQRGPEKGLGGKGNRTQEDKNHTHVTSKTLKKEYMKCDQKFILPQQKNGHTPRKKTLVIWFYYALVSFHSRMQGFGTQKNTEF